MKRITNYLPEFARYKLLNFDLEEIYMYYAVNCIENPYIANYIKKRKQIEDEDVTPSMQLYLPRVRARLRGITALKATSQVR